MKEKFLFLESLRGFAAIGVAIFHTQGLASSSFLYSNSFIQNANLLVDFFFVLSGFVIAYSYSDKINNFESLKKFQFKRFLRLYPLHLITLILFLLFEVIEYYLEKSAGIYTQVPVFIKNDFLAFINNLFLTQSFFENELTYNFPSWSISTEFYTYIVFALITLFFKTEKNRFLISISIVLICGVIIYFTGSERATTGLAIFRCLYSFFLGLFVFQAYKFTNFVSNNMALYFVLMLCIATISISGSIRITIIPLLFALLILLLLKAENNKLKELLKQPSFVFLGTISYGIYMLHSAVWWIEKNVLRFIFGFEGHLDTKSNLIYILPTPIVSTITILIGIMLTIGLASLSYKYIEQPIMQKFNSKERLR